MHLGYDASMKHAIRRLMACLIVMTMMLTQPVSAQTDFDIDDAPLPWPKSTQYVFEYLGMPVGTMQFNTAPSLDAPLNVDATIEVAGVAKLFSDFYNTLSLEVGGAAIDGSARVFQTRYHKGDGKERYIRLGYDANGALSDALRSGIYDMDRREPISDAELARSYDPLSTILLLRSRVYRAVQAQEPGFEHVMYDGKRLYQFNITIYGTRGFEWRGETVSVQKIGLTHRAIGGLTEKEKARRKGYQFEEMVMYFTADQRFLPIYAKQPYKLGAFKLRME